MKESRHGDLIATWWEIPVGGWSNRHPVVKTLMITPAFRGGVGVVI
jgi:hypothetical protein